MDKEHLLRQLLNIEEVGRKEPYTNYLQEQKPAEVVKQGDNKDIESLLNELAKRELKRK